MSDLTRCNYCTFERVKRENPERKVELRADDGWIAVYLDGHPAGHYFKALTTDCIC